MIIGIDPGFKGGVAIVGPTGEFVAGLRMPIATLRGRDMIDAAYLTRWVCDQPRCHTVVIEAVHSMPKQGVSSTFKFGRAAGAAEAWAMSLGSDLEFVSPQKWKRNMGLTSDKRDALTMAQKLWPDAKRWDILRNDGIAEAALIAEWYRTH